MRDAFMLFVALVSAHFLAGFVIVPREPTPEMMVAAALTDIYATERPTSPYSLYAAGRADMALSRLSPAPKVGDDDA